MTKKWQNKSHWYKNKQMMIYKQKSYDIRTKQVDIK